MPPGDGFIAQRIGRKHVEFFWQEHAPGTPDLNSVHRVLSRGFKITCSEMSCCQSSVGTHHRSGIILLLRERVEAFDHLHRYRELVSVVGIAPLTHECHIHEKGTVKGLT